MAKQPNVLACSAAGSQNELAAQLQSQISAPTLAQEACLALEVR